jgi:heptosyltransferase II
VRNRKFDFVIDLHSLAETNLLGFLSGAKKRLYAHRENRSLDILGSFDPHPPKEEKSQHLTDRYLEVLKPLGIENPKRSLEIRPPEKEIKEVRQFFRELGINQKKSLVGMFLGAGHPSRRWRIDNFARLAEKLSQDKKLQVLVFLGPEELNLLDEINAKFPSQAIILNKLELLRFFAAVSCLQVLVSNDTGPMHLGAIAGTSIVLILDKSAPLAYLPLTEKVEIVKTGKIDEIKVEDVFQATQRILEK